MCLLVSLPVLCSLFIPVNIKIVMTLSHFCVLFFVFWLVTVFWWLESLSMGNEQGKKAKGGKGQQPIGQAVPGGQAQPVQQQNSLPPGTVMAVPVTLAPGWFLALP